MKILALDGNSLLNRAYYGVMPLNAPDGTPTNAVYGFINILNKLKNEHNPDAVYVAQDLKAPTFRHKLYDGYKATRHGMPDELAAQIPIYNEYLDLCGITRYAVEGYEADDLLGTLGRLCGNAGHDCYIVTGDRDALQLASDRVSIIHILSRLGRTETVIYTPETVFERYGLTPAQLIDLKALMGDKSDNIPGIVGVGEKTALDLMRRFGSLETIYEHLDELTPSMKSKIENGKEMAYLSRTLSRIDINAPVDLPHALNSEEPRDLTGFYKKLGFKKFLNNEKTQNEQLSLF